jgi:hypothetical protein
MSAMLRVVLTAYLVLFTAAGPSLCCCTTLRGLAPCASGSADFTGAEPAGGCCCAGEAAASCCAADVDCCTAPAPPSPKRSCPCKQTPAGCCLETLPYAPVDGDSLVRRVVHLAYDLPVAGLAVVPAPADPAPCEAAAADGPFWSVTDLLHVQHRLRC